MKKTLVLLAAGKGSRFGGLKQLYTFQPQDATLAEYAIWDALKAGFETFIAIVNSETHAAFDAIFSKLNLKKHAQCIEQDNQDIPANLRNLRQKPWGTGHALYIARNAIQTPFVVVNGDDFYGQESYQQAATFLKDNKQDIALIGYPMQFTLSQHGYVSRALCQIEKNKVTALQECTHIERQGKKIIGRIGSRSIILDGQQWVSMNFWILQPSILSFLSEQWQIFLKNLSDPKMEEFFLPTAIQTIAKRANISICLLPNISTSWRGITYAQDVETVQQHIYSKTRKGYYPENFFNSS